MLGVYSRVVFVGCYLTYLVVGVAAVMIPIPQYPLYTASLAEYGLEAVDYFLDEEKNWGLDLKDLQRAYAEGSKNASVRAIVVINPGNPTGQVGAPLAGTDRG